MEALSRPEEFTPQYVEEHSPLAEQLYTGFLKSGEPYRSLYRADFHTSARSGYMHDPNSVEGGPTPGLDLSDDGAYYNTSGSAAAYWEVHDLPKPAKDIRALRRDLAEWGYCLIEDGLSRAQYEKMKKRLADQAAGERRAGVACFTGTPPAPGEPIPTTQFLHCLINKGEQFVQCVEHDPEGVQAGPVIEQLLHETMGKDFLMSSFIAIISNRHNMPQSLHQDQAIAPFQDANAPFTVNTMYVMDDMTEHNGGTLVVPGSHKLLSEAGSGAPIERPLPPAINLEAPAGTVMIFEGRLLHGTGVNKSDASRTILVMNSVKPFMRQQELHLMSATPEVLQGASRKLLYRLGARPTGLGGIEGTWSGDYLVNQRIALENGEYVRIGELSPDSPVDELVADFTYRISDTGYRQAAHQPDVPPAVRERLPNSEPRWKPAGKKARPR